MNHDLPIEDLGRSPYRDAWQRQQDAHAAVVDGSGPERVFLVEHDPVLTLGRRAKSANLLASKPQLAEQGVDVVETNRGGDVTYHGPGQLVVYPIVDLNRRSLNLSQYVWTLEQAIIQTLADFDIPAGRDADAVGVWVGSGLNPQSVSRNDAGRGDAKIAAIGIRVQKRVTLHGLALNVCPDMSHFNLIVPCGLVGRPVTSMAEQLGDACPDMGWVKTAIVGHLQQLLSISTER